MFRFMSPGMRHALRTLAQVLNLRRATAGKIGADVVAVCDTCENKWTVHLQTAIRERGDTVTTADLVGQANCPVCTGGKVGSVYCLVDDTPMSRLTWGFGHIDRYLDTADSFATERQARKPRR